jgi:hypothetical protein
MHTCIILIKIMIYITYPLIFIAVSQLGSPGSAVESRFKPGTCLAAGKCMGCTNLAMTDPIYLLSLFVDVTDA